MHDHQTQIQPTNRQEDLNLGPLDYKSSSLTTRPCCKLYKMWMMCHWYGDDTLNSHCHWLLRGKFKRIPFRVLPNIWGGQRMICSMQHWTFSEIQAKNRTYHLGCYQTHIYEAFSWCQSHYILRNLLYWTP